MARPNAPGAWVSKDATGEKRAFVEHLFARLAPRYDWFNRLASCGLDQRWRRLTLRYTGVTPGMRVLDLCTGTGDLALACAQQPCWQGTVIGLDFTAAMLERARRKRDAGDVGWVRGDAQTLPFATDTFDRVVIGFSTRNLTDLELGLREMVRVVRPGGQVAILETGRPRHPLVRAGYHLFLGTVVRAIGFLLTGRVWPFTYLARSVRQFLSPEALAARLRAVSTDVVVVPLSGGLAMLYLATKRAESCNAVVTSLQCNDSAMHG